MLYLYNKDAGLSSLVLKGDEHRYIFKVRRHKVEQILHLRNLKDDKLYEYKITKIDKQSVSLVYLRSQTLIIEASKSLHLGWCIIEPKNIEKVLPSLNEIGVAKISFIYCSRSQKSFKLDFKRLEKILINSSQQSGRSKLMELELVDSLEEFIQIYPHTKFLHFSKENLLGEQEIKTVVIGCEGGFSPEELRHLNQENIIGLNTPLVLKSESAICSVASKILL